MNPPRFLRSTFARYGLAAAVMLLAVLGRAALVPVIGLNVPYLTIYPAMMIVAVTLGVGPGVFATVAGVLLAEHYFMPSAGAMEWNFSLAIRSVILLVASLYVGRIGQNLRAARARAEAEATAARAAEAALRQQVDLIDPVRAEVIMREMQRVLRARRVKSEPASAPSGEWLRRVPDVAGLAVAAVGLLALAGWVFGIAALKSVLPGLTTMKFNTALCFLLAGTALALRERRALRVAGAALVGFVAALSLAEYITGADFGIDQLLFRDPGDTQTVPGRMALATSICFILTCASLLLAGARARAALWGQQAVALAAGILGFVALLGYACEVQQLYGLGGFSSMALHTTTAFILLGAGLLCVRTDGLASLLMTPGPGAQLARRLLPAALLAPALLGWFHVMGEHAGLFGPELGAGLFALAMILFLGALVWGTARALNRADATRRKTETQLRNQAALMDHAREALIVHELGGAIRFWNRGAEALYGWPAAEALGQRTHVLLRTEGVMPERIETQLEQTGHWEGELVHLTRDGRRVTVESRQTAARAADDRLLILASNRDITARKRDEEQIRKLNAELEQRVADRTAELRVASLYARSLIEASLDPLVTISPDGKITDVNRATEEITGVPRERLVGSNFSGYFTEPEKAEAGYQKVLAEGLVRDYPLTICHATGRAAEVLYNATLYRDEVGRVQGVFAAARDITERKRLEEAHEELLRRLSEAQETERGRISRELHDRLGQDLTALKLGLQLFRRHGPFAAAVEETIGKLEQLADGLVRDIHRLAWELRPAVLDDLGLEAALRRYTTEWSENSGVPLDFHSQGLEARRLPQELETTLYRIAQEALSNVVRHANARRVSVLLERRPGHISLIVEDNGDGFEVDTLMQTSVTQGKLGLLGMQERVMLVRGTLEIESTPGAGTAVFVRIPLGQTAGGEVRNHEKASDSAGRRP
jgi:PAS domain S-box-containing protein